MIWHPRIMEGWRSRLKVFALLLGAFALVPLLAVLRIVDQLLGRRWLERIDRHSVERIELVDGAIVVGRGGSIDRIELVPGDRIEIVEVDYCGAFADANEFGVLFRIGSHGAPGRWLGCKYWDNDVDSFVRAVEAANRVHGRREVQARRTYFLIDLFLWPAVIVWALAVGALV